MTNQKSRLQGQGQMTILVGVWSGEMSCLYNNSEGQKLRFITYWHRRQQCTSNFSQYPSRIWLFGDHTLVSWSGKWFWNMFTLILNWHDCPAGYHNNWFCCWKLRLFVGPSVCWVLWPPLITCKPVRKFSKFKYHWWLWCCVVLCVHAIASLE